MHAGVPGKSHNYGVMNKKNFTSSTQSGESVATHLRHCERSVAISGIASWLTPLAMAK